MIVIGADTHKRSHTVAAVEAVTGRSLGERTVSARGASFDLLLAWARSHGAERVWAIEDCRHVSGALERFVLVRGEAVVRIAPKLTAHARKAAREGGKSDGIDAVAIARTALREGLDTLPVARLAGPELDVRLLVDHRERLVAQRTALSNDLRWHLHDLWPETEIPPRALTTVSWQTRISGRLTRAEQSARVRIARDALRRIRALTRTINALEHELAALVCALAPKLLAERGCGTLMAAKLLGEIAGVNRFATDAELARTAGSAPIPASSGRTQRHRLDRGGNRQLNCALHRLAVIKGRLDPETAAYLARRQTEGKTRREAIRCLKRHLARREFFAQLFWLADHGHVHAKGRLHPLQAAVLARAFPSESFYLPRIPAPLQQAIARPLAALARRRGYTADPAGLAGLAARVLSEERPAVSSQGEYAPNPTSG